MLTANQTAVARRWFVDHRSDIADARRGYQWPPGIPASESLRRRDALAERTAHAVAASRTVPRDVWRAILEWGFNADASVLREISDASLDKASAAAIGALSGQRLAEAAKHLLALKGIGIARASKVLALTDQARFGIYDSRVGRAVDDLRLDGNRLVEIPPGRGIQGTTSDADRLCRSFERLNDLLDLWRGMAADDRRTRGILRRAADIEMGLFMLGGGR